jgi:quinol monooxygenase YgiN
MKLENGYYITAEIKVKDSAKIEFVKKELQILQRLTLEEVGCNFFSIQQDNSVPTRFIMWERFDDEDSFKDHFKYEHTKRYASLDLTEIIQYFQTNIIN